MALPGRIPELLENNKAFQATYQTPPDIVTVTKMIKKAGNGILALACLDPRVVPEKFLGPSMGVGVLRNAGGRATQDVINSIVILRSLAGVQTVMVVHHTDCGMTTQTDDQITREALERTPDAADELKGVKYGTFTKATYEQELKADVLALRNAKVLAGMDIYGFSFDVTTGAVSPVEV